MFNEEVTRLLSSKRSLGYALMVWRAALHLNKVGYFSPTKLQRIGWRLLVDYKPLEGRVTDLTHPQREIISKYNEQAKARYSKHLEYANRTGGGEAILLTMELLEEKAPMLVRSLGMTPEMLASLGKIFIIPHGGEFDGSWVIPYQEGLAIGVPQVGWFGFATQLALVVAMLNPSGVHTLGPDSEDAIGFPLTAAAAVALSGEDHRSLNGLAEMLIEGMAKQAPKGAKCLDRETAKKLQRVLLPDVKNIWNRQETLWAIEQFIEISKLLIVEGDLNKVRAELEKYFGETGTAMIILLSHIRCQDRYTVRRLDMMRKIGAIGPS